MSIVEKDLLSILGSEKDSPLRDIVSFDLVDVDEPLLYLNIDTEKDVVELLENEHFFTTL